MKEGLHTGENGSTFYHLHLEGGDLMRAKPFFDSAATGRPVEYDDKRFNLIGLEKLEPPDHPDNGGAWNILVREVTRRTR